MTKYIIHCKHKNKNRNKTMPSVGVGALAPGPEEDSLEQNTSMASGARKRSLKSENQEHEVVRVGWTTALPSGERIPARGGHSCILADFQLVVFGGHYYVGDEKFAYLNDVWVLDVESMTWQKVKCGGTPPEPRYGHACQAVGSRMFVFGGKGAGKQVFKDVYMLDLVSWTWSAVNCTSAGPVPRFQSGEHPRGSQDCRSRGLGW